MVPHTLASLGGPFVNAKLVKDPASQMDARFGNRLIEDVAQLTRTGMFAWVQFITNTGGAAAMDPADIIHFTIWGSSSATKPVGAKIATGEYRFTFATTFDDALVGVVGMESVAETQSVVFTFSTRPNVRGSAWGDARITQIASNVIDLTVYDDTLTASDLGGDITVEFGLR